MYEMSTKGVSDDDRIKGLVTHLENDALEWLADEIAPNELNWAEVKAKFLARYGTAIANPAVAAQYRTMNRKDTVKTYGQEKMRLCRLAGYPLESSLHLLTIGAPVDYQTTLFAREPKSFDDWLRTAMLIENSQQIRNRSRFMNKPMATVNAIDEKKPKKRYDNKADRSDKPKKSKYPCRICQEKGIAAYHYYYDCASYKKNSGYTKPVESYNIEPMGPNNGPTTQF